MGRESEMEMNVIPQSGTLPGYPEHNAVRQWRNNAEAEALSVA
jgi:hypothetical protein